MGNVVEVDGRLHVIEYSDLPDDVAAAAQRRRLAGDLGRQHRGARVRRGVPASGWPSQADALPFHSRRRRSPTSTTAATRIEPAEPNAIKFERFIFDLLPWARTGRSWSRSTRRAFAPLKNAPGKPSGHARDGVGPKWSPCTPSGCAGRASRWPTRAGRDQPAVGPGRRRTRREDQPRDGPDRPTDFFAVHDSVASRCTPDARRAVMNRPARRSAMLHAVIMAGGSAARGSGPRAGPSPQATARLRGPRTMIQATVDRLGDLVPPERVFVATTDDWPGRSPRTCPSCRAASIIVEPCKRDTAPCIGLAAIRILARRSGRRDGGHAGRPRDRAAEEFQATRSAMAAALVEENPARMVTFGIRPTYPAESFGYIERGEPLESARGRRRGVPAAYRVQQFHEKPEAATWPGGIWRRARSTGTRASLSGRPARFSTRSAGSSRMMRDAPRSDRRPRPARPDFDEVLRREFAAIERSRSTTA